MKVTSENQQLDNSPPAAPTGGSGRRRMAGYQPRTGEETAKTGGVNAQTEARPTSTSTVSASTAPSDQQLPATPARKTRMGQQAAPAPQESTGAVAPDSAQPTQKRMGGGANATGRTPRRMAGAAPSAPAGRQRMGETQPVTSAPSGRQRMGSPAAVVANGHPPQAATGASTRMAQPGTSDSAGTQTAASKDTARPRWVRPALMIGGILVLALIIVLCARWLRTLEPIQQFIATYDGHASQPEVAPTGIPAWLGWQHFLNMFFIVLIVRRGLQVRLERKPAAHWTAKKNSFFSPPGAKPKKVSISQWLHQSLDVLWVVNGLIFIVLLFLTDHWMRIVPTSWDIFPNMVSGVIQYASLDWPTENGWVHYNALQVMAYFVTVFIAAPLAIISGLRISTWWPDQNQRLNKLYPVEVARAVHFPVMLYFVVFTIVHVFLVFFTGALRNLNHMYTSRDVVDWWGLVIFLASLLVIAAGWFVTQPLFTRPVAAKTGEVTK